MKRFLLIIILYLTLSIPTASAEGFSEDYIIVSHDVLMNTYTLLHNDSTLLGDYLTIQSNTDKVFTVKLDGVVYYSGNDTFSTRLMSPLLSIEVTDADNSYFYSNFTHIMRNDMGWFFNSTNPNFITIDSSESLKNDILTHVGTFVIIYFLSTTVVYKVASYKVNREVDLWI